MPIEPWESVAVPLMLIPILFVAAPLGFALIVGLILFLGRARPVTGLGPAPAPHGQLPTSGVWNAMIMDGPVAHLGGTMGSSTGRFRIENGSLTFIPDDGGGVGWSVPCAHITAQPSLGLLGGGVTLWMPNGQLRCVVSREHINRFMSNDIKQMRQVRYYREFVSVLAANHARVV